MPLIRPEIQKVLRAVGLEKEQSILSLDEQLNEAGLSSETLAENLAGIALHSNNDTLRLRALETVLKVKGAMRENAGALPTFNIVIQNFSPQEMGRTSGINPIIFPRQSLLSAPLGQPSAGSVGVEEVEIEVEAESDDESQEQ